LKIDENNSKNLEKFNKISIISKYNLNKSELNLKSSKNAEKYPKK